MQKILPYLWLGFGLFMVYIASLQAEGVFHFLDTSPEAHLLMVFFLFALICIFSFIVFTVSNGTTLPSFVVAILFGIAGNNFFEPLIHQHVALSSIVGFGATLILFGGGLETPWENFKKLIWKIASLSFLGLFVTALLFSSAVIVIGGWFGVEVSIVAALLLGAVLASTDPAAIIPVLKRLKFYHRDTKDIIVSESAMTDVTGTLLTVVFLTFIGMGTTFSGIGDGYKMLFTQESGIILFRQLSYGVLLGVFGYFLLDILARQKKRHGVEFETDAAYFVFVPTIIFTIALAFGGSGYLAAFIAGLLFVLSENLHVTEKFFNQMIEGFLKPTIFLLLGALVDVGSLIAYAGIGIVASFVFMFVIRPIAVFLSLGLFVWLNKREKIGVRELWFISFVRETGAIPAVLLVTIAGLNLPNVEGLLPIGMWVILATLILQPPLTPLVAKFLNVATIKGESAKEAAGHHALSGAKAHN